MQRLFVISVLVLTAASTAWAAETKQAKIQRALSAAPGFIKASATVADFEQGKMVVLRPGTNRFTCIPGTPGVVGDDPMCMDAQAQLWVQSLVAHKPKPENTAPGVIYMQAGGTDYNDADPWATKTAKVLHDAPHWMIMWPFDPKKTGLPARWRATGTWIMFAGTPYAHLMIIQHL